MAGNREILSMANIASHRPPSSGLRPVCLASSPLGCSLKRGHGSPPPSFMKTEGLAEPETDPRWAASISGLGRLAPLSSKPQHPSLSRKTIFHPCKWVTFGLCQTKAADCFILFICQEFIGAHKTIPVAKETLPFLLAVIVVVFNLGCSPKFAAWVNYYAPLSSFVWPGTKQTNSSALCNIIY